jgi:hypothetical protein
VRPEPTQKGNRHGLTVQQHVLQHAGIARFAGPDGKVAVKLCGKPSIQRLLPNHNLFCARRLWDQRSEAGYMKGIEDEFQRLVESILRGSRALKLTQTLSSQDFSLSGCCAQLQHHPIPDHILNGVLGEPLTKDQQERCEKSWGAFVRPDQSFPGRFLSGLQIQAGIDALSTQWAERRWGIVRANEGEFICPDTSGQLAAVPLTPTVSLHLDHEDSVIPRSEVARRNVSAQRLARRYSIARDFAACPL